MDAVAEIKAKMKAVGGAFLSTEDGKHLVDQVKRAALTADSFGLSKSKKSKVLSALLQTSETEPEEYSFQGGEILSMVEDLENDFKDTKSDVEADEEESVSVFKSLIEDKTKEMNDANDMMNDRKKRSGVKTEKIAKSAGDLTATKAVLTDDQQYIKDLTAKCELKSKEWDQRSQMRQDELTAISTAISIVSGKVKEKTTSKTVRFMQIPKPMKVEDTVESTQDEVDEIMETEEVTNFLQVQKPRKRLAEISAHMKMREMAKVEKKLFEERVPEDTVRNKVVTLLRESSIELKSPTL